MSKEKGIFEPQEGFASGPAPRSPFSVEETPNNPFASGPETKSPFAVGDNSAKQGSDPGGDSDPFASGIGKTPFSYEPPVAGFGGSPFEGTPAPGTTRESPFGSDGQDKKEEPKASSQPFGDPGPPPAPATPPPAPASTPAPAPAPVQAPATPAASNSGDSFESDSSSIRQLELRAIFGVDRELSESEILQRSRSLPGVRKLARVPDGDIAAIDGLKRVVGGLGFGDGKVQLVYEKVPVDFIREGRVLLAVQTDGSFAPGVRETLMIVARELGRM